MKYKNLILIFIFIFLTQCGYTSVYKSNPNENLAIQIISLSGDQYLNKSLNSELRMYFQNDSKRIYKLNINTNFEKKIISKNAEGKASNFELIASVIFEVSYDNNNKKFNFIENVKIENKDDSFEQRKYENNIKKNFAKLIKEKLILKLSTL